MESIRQAVERARADRSSDIDPLGGMVRQRPPHIRTARPGLIDDGLGEVELKASFLQSNRIVAHISGDISSKPYDILRTQVLRAMDLKGWKILAVTSPTPECGKTLTAINLALSIARQPERSVLLIDMDLQRPRIASALGVTEREGVLGVLGGSIELKEAIVQARIGNHRFMVLPAEAPTSDSSEWMTSHAMSAMMNQIKLEYQSRLVILDLPPMLSGDDVIAILPQVDCVLLVAAVGTSTIAQIEECNKHLQSTDVVRVVLNKVPQMNLKYHYY
jgi:Mrp family chromosome partitioning ATPase